MMLNLRYQKQHYSVQLQQVQEQWLHLIRQGILHKEVFGVSSVQRPNVIYPREKQLFLILTMPDLKKKTNKKNK